MEAIKEQIHGDCDLIAHVTRIWKNKKQLTQAQKIKLKLLAKGAPIRKFGDQFRLNGEHIDPRTVESLENHGYIWWSSRDDVWKITEEGRAKYKELKKRHPWLY
jgi:hypothetical protein